MTENPPPETLLAAAGLPAEDARAWLRARPPEAAKSLDEDRERYGRFFARGAALVERLPQKSARSAP
ncbi:MAG: hypothetical protein WCA09_01295, partial [Burkholderiales bacterium]